VVTEAPALLENFVPAGEPARPTPPRTRLSDADAELIFDRDIVPDLLSGGPPATRRSWCSLPGTLVPTATRPRASTGLSSRSKRPKTSPNATRAEVGKDYVPAAALPRRPREDRDVPQSLPRHHDQPLQCVAHPGRWIDFGEGSRYWLVDASGPEGRRSPAADQALPVPPCSSTSTCSVWLDIVERWFAELTNRGQGAAPSASPCSPCWAATRYPAGAGCHPCSGIASARGRADATMRYGFPCPPCG